MPIRANDSDDVGGRRAYSMIRSTYDRVANGCYSRAVAYSTRYTQTFSLAHATAVSMLALVYSYERGERCLFVCGVRINFFSADCSKRQRRRSLMPGDLLKVSYHALIHQTLSCLTARLLVACANAYSTICCCCCC